MENVSCFRMSSSETSVELNIDTDSGVDGVSTRTDDVSDPSERLSVPSVGWLEPEAAVDLVDLNLS